MLTLTVDENGGSAMVGEQGRWWAGIGMAKVIIVKRAVSAVGETRDKQADRRQLDSLRQT